MGQAKRSRAARSWSSKTSTRVRLAVGVGEHLVERGVEQGERAGGAAGGRGRRPKSGALALEDQRRRTPRRSARTARGRRRAGGGCELSTRRPSSTPRGRGRLAVEDARPTARRGRRRGRRAGRRRGTSPSTSSASLRVLAEHGVDLAREVVEQGAPGDLGRVGEVLHREAVETVLVGEPLRAERDPVAGVPPLLLAQARCTLGHGVQSCTIDRESAKLWRSSHVTFWSLRSQVTCR